MEKITEEFDGILYYNRKEFLENAAYNQGEKDGFQDGKLEGEKRKQIEIAKEMIQENFNISMISKITKLSKKEIESIQKKSRD